MELLGMFDGNVPSLVVIGIFMLAGTFVSALVSNGYFSKMLKGMGRGKSIADLAERMDRLENGVVPGLDKTLERIEYKIDDLSENVLEVEKRLNYADKSSLMGIIHNSSIHTTDRLRAFNNYLKLGGNGTVADYAVEELVRPNREEWIRVVDESRMKIHCDRYHERIASIKNRLAGGF